MSQTTEEVVSKTPERWRVLESEETAIPLVAHLARCRFFTGASWSITGRYELSASSRGRQGGTKKEDVKDPTCFPLRYEGSQSNIVPHHSPTHLRAQTGYVVFGGLFISPILVLWQALTLDSLAWHPARRKQRQRTQRALREHTGFSAARLEFAKRLLRFRHGSTVPLMAQAAGQCDGKGSSGFGNVWCTTAARTFTGLAASSRGADQFC